MQGIKKRYIVDENNKKLVVEIDIATFIKIEEIIENYGLYKLMRETDDSGSMTLNAAKKYYKSIKK